MTSPETSITQWTVLIAKAAALQSLSISDHVPHTYTPSHEHPTTQPDTRISREDSRP
ncbi:hypothetical protein [Rhodococcoides fascians]|uniref:hypothetical protein n=1 Tax=Rhodococcoides fascians TaxID=1828 RepID=UPI000A4B3838|nr:hypothetical protein [Rhodococcus fascians]